MRKDPPGFIAQMKIMLAGLDQIKHESQIREQQKEGRRAASSWRFRQGSHMDVLRLCVESQIWLRDLELNLSFAQISKQSGFVIPCVVDPHTMSSYLYQRDKQRK